MSAPVSATRPERAVPKKVPFLDLSGTTEEVRADVEAGWREVVGANRFIGGPAVAAFEQEWAAYCGTRHAVGVANGTDALHWTLRALGIGPGDDVILPANTFVATAEAVVLAGARPRFADVDAGTLLLTPEHVEAVATSQTRAIIVVHLYGQMPDMDRLVAVARHLGAHLVEDAAQAHGATSGSRRAGSSGIAGCFSFYPGKNLGAFGDAGAVVTSDDELALALQALRAHGRCGDRHGDGHHDHRLLGTNSRLDASQAVVLSAKLPRLDGWNENRRALMAVYRELLDPEVAPLVDELPGGRGVHHLAVVRVRNRDRVRAGLAELNIETGIHYPVPCHLMAPYLRFADGPLPAAERAGAQVLSLPMYPHLDVATVEYVALAVNAAARQELLR